MDDPLANDLASLIAKIKAEPGKMACASLGPSNTRVTRTTPGWRNRASNWASRMKLERPQSKVVRWRSDLGCTLMPRERLPYSSG